MVYQLKHAKIILVPEFAEKKEKLKQTRVQSFSPFSMVGTIRLRKETPVSFDLKKSMKKEFSFVFLSLIH